MTMNDRTVECRTRPPCSTKRFHSMACVPRTSDPIFGRCTRATPRWKPSFRYMFQQCSSAASGIQLQPDCRCIFASSPTVRRPDGIRRVLFRVQALPATTQPVATAFRNGSLRVRHRQRSLKCFLFPLNTQISTPLSMYGV